MAIWDVVAKIEGKSLSRHLADMKGREANPKVFVYAAGTGRVMEALRGRFCAGITEA